MVHYQFHYGKEPENREEPMDKVSEAITGGMRADEREVSSFKRLRAKICEHCPFCIHARKNPDSTIGKILHHKYHAEHCPLWTAYQDVHRESGDRKSDS